MRRVFAFAALPKPKWASSSWVTESALIFRIWVIRLPLTTAVAFTRAPMAWLLEAVPRSRTFSQ